MIFYHPSPCVCSSIWTIHQSTNGSTSKFHLKMSTPSYPFQHVFWQDIWSPCARILSCFGLRANVWLIAWLIFPIFQLSSPVFLHNISYTTWTTPSLNCKHPHRPYGYPPLMLCSWQWTHQNLCCNSRHLYCHCVKCWFPCGTRIIICVFFNHIQLLSLTNRHWFYQRWHSHLSRCCH